MHPMTFQSRAGATRATSGDEPAGFKMVCLPHHYRKDQSMAGMTEERLLDFFDACNERDLDRITDFFTDHAVYLGSRGVHDDGTPYMGRDEVRHGMDAFLNSHSDLRYSDLDIHLAGRYGFATWTFTGRQHNGSEYSYRGVDVFTFEGDRISRKDAFRKERVTPPA